MPTADNLKWLGGIAAVVGLWVIATPFVWGLGGRFLWLTVILGVVIAVLSGYTAYLATTEGRVRRSIAYLAAIGGLVVIVSPYAFQISEPNLLLNNFVAGGLIAILAGYSGYVGPAISAPGATDPAV